MQVLRFMSGLLSLTIKLFHPVCFFFFFFFFFFLGGSLYPDNISRPVECCGL